MNNRRQDIAEAKLKLPLPTLMENIGDGAHAKKSARCPFHKDSSNSFSVFETKTGDWLWKCHASCGSGDGVDYLEKRCNLTTREAIARYCREAGLNGSGAARAATRSPTKPEFNWQSCLNAFTDEDAYELSKWRGFSPEFVSWLRKEEVAGVYEGKPAFPVHNEQGQIVGCHYRASDKLWLYHPKGNPTRPLVFGNVRSASYVLAFESQWDAFAVMDRLNWHSSVGFADYAVFITRGAGNGNLIRGQCSSEAILYTFVQNDKPKADGKIPAEEWLGDIAEAAGCKVLRVTTPAPHKDANDWTRSGATGEQIDAAVRSAKPIETSVNTSIATAHLQTESSLQHSPPPIVIPRREHPAGQRPGRPVVQLPGDNRLLSDFAVELGKVLARENIFQRCGSAYTVNYGGDGLTPMTPDTLRSWVEQFCSCYKIKRVDESGLTVTYKRTMTATDAEGVLNSPQFISQLQAIERFNLVRMPVMRPDGTVELLPEGYDRLSKTFTASDATAPTTRLQLQDARRIVDSLLAEFGFADVGRSRAVVVAGMLTVYALGLLPSKSLRPCFIFVANAEGAGKTLLVKICTVPVLGYAPTGRKPKDEAEMAKMLLSAVMEAKPVLFFDNIKGRLSSESLESFLTAQDWADRILGGNSTFRGENNATVFITGNGCTVSPDMRRRSLFGELFLEAERAEDRDFHQPLEVPLLLKMRWDILNALWTFVSEWADGGAKPASRSHSGFPAWANIIGGIVEAAGYECPLETPTVAVDTDGEDMRSLVSILADGASLRSVAFEEVVNAAKANGLFEWLIPDSEDLDTKARSKFASILKGYDGRLVGEYRFGLLDKGRNRRFKVEKVAPPVKASK